MKEGERMAFTSPPDALVEDMAAFEMTDNARQLGYMRKAGQS